MMGSALMAWWTWLPPTGRWQGKRHRESEGVAWWSEDKWRDREEKEEDREAMDGGSPCLSVIC